MKRTVLILLAVLAITGSALTASEPPVSKVAAAGICQFCMQQAGEVCSYAGEPCGIGSGCTCTRLSNGSLACCV